MDTRLFASRFASIVIIGMFFVFPLCFALSVIIKIFSLKSILKKAGDCYYKAEIKKPSVISLYTNIVLIVFCVFMIIFGERLIAIIVLPFVLYFWGEFILNKMYGNVCGIYKNGIIDGNRNLKEWNEIDSYMIADNTISGYFDNRNIFTFKDLENFEEIKTLFEKNNVKKRDLI
jgi:ACR3 family arsenite efflux pump ArsB